MDGWMVCWLVGLVVGLRLWWPSICSSVSLHICHGMKESNCGREGGSKNCLWKVLDVEMTGYLTGLSELALIE